MPNTSAKTILKVITTTADRLRELPIVNGQMVFVKDACRIAFDQNDKRTFYNQIIELESEVERGVIAPHQGYYFVIDTAIMWYYDAGKWTQITKKPNDFVFVGTELPELGLENKSLYVDTRNKQISVWDDSVKEYTVVADKTDVSVEVNVESVPTDAIRALFNN